MLRVAALATFFAWDDGVGKQRGWGTLKTRVLCLCMNVCICAWRGRFDAYHAALAGVCTPRRGGFLQIRSPLVLSCFYSELLHISQDSRYTNASFWITPQGPPPSLRPGCQNSTLCFGCRGLDLHRDRYLRRYRVMCRNRHNLQKQASL